MTTFFKQIYSEIARHYEKVNHLFTLGFDIYWRRSLARQVVYDRHRSVLDVCTGTGETARTIKMVSRGSIKVVGTDFSNEMLEEARKRAPGIEYIYSDTATLPFSDGSFDAVTMSFAARNLNDGDRSLATYFREIHRVLKRGGVFYNLETSQPSYGLVRFFFRLYVKILVALIGRKFSGNREGYQYLASSIITFDGPEKLAERLKAAGFSKVTYKGFLSNSVAIHKAVK